MAHTLTELTMGISPTVIDETRGFWEGTLAEELRVQVCGACGNRQFPGSACCTACLSQDLSWQAVSGRGEVFAFTIVRHAFHPTFADQIPYALVDVRLDEGPVVTSVLTDVDVSAVAIGMPVRVLFDEQTEDAFHVPLRLPKFKPVEAP